MISARWTAPIKFGCWRIRVLVLVDVVNEEVWRVRVGEHEGERSVYDLARVEPGCHGL